ncbi:MAG: PEGA domain-containing protein [Deltaproteobacteria bacterium]|nr:PEGA domain-containing protein [Deltaproteobacteria bacterium]
MQGIQTCFKSAQPWPCIEPIASPKATRQLVVLELNVDKVGGGIQLRAQLAGAKVAVSPVKNGYCASPCTESTLAQSASDLVGALLDEVTALSGNTFIEVLTEPAGATVHIDTQNVGPSGKKFPSRAGRHRVLIQLSGYVDDDSQVDVAEGETKTVRRTLVLLHELPPPPPTTSHRLQWVMVGGGAAMLGGGLLASYLIGRSSVPDVSEPLRERYSSTPALAVAGIGGAVAVGGLIWLLRSRDSHAGKGSRPAVSISPAGTHAGWAFTF